LKALADDSNLKRKSSEKSFLEIKNKILKRNSHDITVEQSISPIYTPNQNKVHDYTTETSSRNKVLREIINTEEDYIGDLELIVNNYVKPLREEKILNAKDISEIFSIVEMLLNIHRELFKKI